MPFRHKYQTYEVRRLLQQAENQPSPITAKPAHSRGLHAGKIHGGEGASKADMMTRTHKQAGDPAVGRRLPGPQLPFWTGRHGGARHRRARQ